MQIWFVLAFAILGAGISGVCGFLVGNRMTYILFVSFLSTLAFSGLGFGVYATLEKKVPEFLEFLGQFSLGLGSGAESLDEDETLGWEPSGEGSPSSDDFGVGAVAQEGAEMRMAATKSGKFGDHIMVDKIAIKNEPKLMAEAIRTMMAKDDMAES